MHCRLLLITTAFLASVPAFAATDSKLTVPEDVDLFTKRALQTVTNGEDRAFSASVTEGLSNWVSRAAPKLLLTNSELEHLAMKMAPAAEVFKTLKLDDGLNGILRNPNLMLLDDYILKTGAKDPELEFITPFINKYGDKVLAEFLFDAKKVGKTEKMATRMQSAQFRKWFNDRKTAAEVYRLLRLRHDSADRYEKLWWECVDAYVQMSIKFKKPIPFEL